MNYLAALAVFFLILMIAFAVGVNGFSNTDITISELLFNLWIGYALVLAPLSIAIGLRHESKIDRALLISGVLGILSLIVVAAWGLLRLVVTAIGNGWR